MSIDLVVPPPPVFGGQVSGTKSGVYYFLGPTASTATLSNQVLRTTPVRFPKAVTLSKVGAEVTIAGDAGSVFRIGLWADDGNGYPGVLVSEIGTIAGDSATVQEISIALALGAGGYHIGGVVQGVTVTTPTFRTAASVLGTGGAAANTSSQFASLGFQQTGVSGALPDPFGSTAASVGAMARFFWKVL